MVAKVEPRPVVSIVAQPEPDLKLDLPDVLTPGELAEFLRTTPAALAQMRWKKVGPDHFYMGRQVRYMSVAVAAWIATNTAFMSASSNSEGP